MRYVPNLIPDRSKVLPDYFKGNIYEKKKKSPLIDTFLWVIGGSFLIGALISIKHPIMALIFGLIGLILIPPGHRFIEQELKFRLTSKIKALATLLLLISSIPLTGHYNTIDKQEAYQQKLNEKKAAKEKIIAEQKEQIRKDSLTFYIQQGNRLAKEHKTDEANKQLQHAMTFASLATDKEKIEQEKINIAVIKTSDLVKKGKYQAALPEINNLLNTFPSNSELILNRAICYSKTGKIREAVNDLRLLVQAGNPEAKKLHEKINPVRKRVAYSVTKCCDGTTSNATDRGACSHHGGVCNWNEPVYEEYRKY